MTRKTHNSYTAKNVSGSWNKTWISIITLIIAIITTVVICFVVYKNIDNIKDIFNGPDGDELVEDDGELHVGDPIEIEWQFTNDGDLLNYTHRLHTAKYGTLGVMSRNLDLTLYQGEVKIKGLVDKLQGDTYVIEVYAIIGDKIEQTLVTGDIDLTAIKSGVIYIPQAGLFLPEEFFTQYELVNITADKILLKNLVSGTGVELGFFKCDDGNTSSNCTKINESFSQAASNSFNTAGEVTFYHNSEVDTWFFTNDLQRGYFLHKLDTAEVSLLAKNIEFINNKFVENNVLKYVSSLCKQSGDYFQDYDDYQLDIQKNKVMLTIEGISFDKKGTCVLELDPVLEVGGRLEEINFKEIEVGTGEDTDEVEEDDGNLDLDDFTYDEDSEDEDTEEDEEEFDGEAFPINLESTYVFKSWRGHTITFPSKNILFMASKEVKDLEIEKVNCRAAIDVTKYDKERADDDFIAKPSAIIYECTVKEGADIPSKYRHLIVQEDRDFLIEVVNPGWKDFAESIVIE